MCRRLRKHHSLVFARVLALMDTDLLKSKDKWAAGVKELRDLFASVEREGFPRESQAAWRLHWDYQLYKAGHQASAGVLQALMKAACGAVTCHFAAGGGGLMLAERQPEWTQPLAVTIAAQVCCTV